MQFSTFSSKVNYFLILLFSCCLPLNKKWLPIIIAILILSWLIGLNFKERLNNLKRNRYLLIIIFVYVLYIIGIIYSKDLHYGFDDLGKKASLIIFPVIVCEAFLLKWNQVKLIFLSFNGGCFIACIICLIHSCFKYNIKHDLIVFLYADLSFFLHPAYFAMYLCFVNSLLVYYLFFYKENIPKTNRVIAFALMIFFSGFIVLLNSKTGILTLAMLFIISLIYYLIRYRNFLLIITIFITIVILFFGIQHFVISPVNPRFESAKENIQSNDIDSTTTESTNVRLLIWKTSIKIIKENYLIGVGTGDVKDVLFAKYKEKGMAGALKNELNAHDQFLQTFITLGLPGILLLLSVFIFPIINSVKSGNYVLFCFLIITFINFLTESMLETISGVVFFSFFYSLLIANNKRDELLHKQ